jgi:hypothetical protein
LTGNRQKIGDDIMNEQIGTKAGLLAAVADGKAHSAWEFAAGTLGWAKRNGLVAAGPTVSPVMYTVTEKGRKVIENIERCGMKGYINLAGKKCLEWAMKNPGYHPGPAKAREDMDLLVDYASGVDFGGGK